MATLKNFLEPSLKGIVFLKSNELNFTWVSSSLEVNMLRLKSIAMGLK